MKRFRIFLKEDNAGDNIRREEAEYVWKRIAEYLHKFKMPRNDQLSGSSEYKVMTATLRATGKKIPVAIEFNVGHITKLPQYGTLAFIISGDPQGAEGAYQPNDNTLQIKDPYLLKYDYDKTRINIGNFILGGQPGEVIDISLRPDWSVSRVEDKFRNVFVHEFTHYIDFTRRIGARVDEVMKSYQLMNKAPDFKVAYYNCPVELNAFYQQSVQELDRQFGDLGFMNSTDPKHLKDLLDFNKFWEAFQFLFTPLQVIPFLSDENKRRWQKRLYSHWNEDIKPKIVKYLAEKERLYK